jgi:hypothetical protein
LLIFFGVVLTGGIFAGIFVIIEREFFVYLENLNNISKFDEIIKKIKI